MSARVPALAAPALPHLRACGPWRAIDGLAARATRPVHRAWTLDARRDPRPGDGAIPVGAIWLLRAQIAALYLFAGIAKLNPDWLLHAQPLAICSRTTPTPRSSARS